jgi:glucokinase
MQGSELTIGMDFGVVQVKAGVVFQSHVIDRAAVLPTREFDRPEQLIDAMAGTVAELRDKHPRVAALGIGLPGFVDFDRGIVHTMTHVPDWSSVPIRQILEERTGLPVVVDNRANCMTLAEWRCGAARGLRDVVFINVQTGVGGGIIANGRLVRGSRHGAGEIGQTSIDWQGRAGKYGNRGAVERYLGLEEIEAAARDAYAAAGIDKPAADCALGELIHAAHHGDAVATGIWDAVARMLACALCNTCWLLNPQAVVVGGCVVRAGDLLFTPLREHLCAQLSDPFRDELMILPAALVAEEAGTIGAAALARERLRAAA